METQLKINQLELYTVLEIASVSAFFTPEYLIETLKINILCVSLRTIITTYAQNQYSKRTSLINPTQFLH